MQFFTLGDVVAAVRAELDLTGQDGVADSLCTHDELSEYVNRAISVAESEVHKLNLDDEYFLAQQPLELSVGQKNYALPTNIYATKIKNIMYANGSVIYEIKRLRRSQGRSIFEQAAYIDQYGAADWYRYILRNDGVDFQNEIWLYPTSRDQAPTAVDSQPICTINYVRRANQVVEDSDMIDIPEGIDYIKQFVKCRVLSKQFRGVVPEQEVQLLESLRADMVSSLREMVPDGDNAVDQDLGFYNDFDSMVYTGGEY